MSSRAADSAKYGYAREKLGKAAQHLGVAPYPDTFSVKAAVYALGGVDATKFADAGDADLLEQWQRDIEPFIGPIMRDESVDLVAFADALRRVAQQFRGRHPDRPAGWYEP